MKGVSPINANVKKEDRLNDDQRIEREKQEIVEAMNRAGMPYSVHELILADLLHAVRLQKEQALQGGK